MDLVIPIILLVVTAGFILSATASLILQILVVRRNRKIEHIEQQLLEALDEKMIEVHCPPEKPKNYRHNIHCPKCGRFSKRFEGSDVIVICKAHDLQVRWQDVSIDWISKPLLEKTNYITEPIMVQNTTDTYLIELPKLMDPIMHPDDELALISNQEALI